MHTKLWTACCVFLCLLAACAPAPPATPFIPPTAAKPASTPTVEVIFVTPTPGQALPSETPTDQPTPTDVPASPTPACLSSLLFINDVNYPDGSLLAPGQAFEKQWLVENNGSCDWGTGHSLRFVGGDPLGAAGEVAMFPARAGSQATLSVSFIAPQTPGTYRSTWQPFDPLGQPFGDSFYVEIIVQVP